MVHPGRAWQHLAPDWKLVASVTGLKWADAPEIREAKGENLAAGMAGLPASRACVKGNENLKKA